MGCMSTCMSISLRQVSVTFCNFHMHCFWRQQTITFLLYCYNTHFDFRLLCADLFGWFHRSVPDALRGNLRRGREDQLWGLLLPHGSPRQTDQWHGQARKETEPPQPKPLPLCPANKSKRFSTERAGLNLSCKSLVFLFFITIIFDLKHIGQGLSTVCL